MRCGTKKPQMIKRVSYGSPRDKEVNCSISAAAQAAINIAKIPRDTHENVDFTRRSIFFNNISCCSIDHRSLSTLVLDDNVFFFNWKLGRKKKEEDVVWSVLLSASRAGKKDFHLFQSDWRTKRCRNILAVASTALSRRKLVQIDFCGQRVELAGTLARIVTRIQLVHSSVDASELFAERRIVNNPFPGKIEPPDCSSAQARSITS